MKRYSSIFCMLLVSCHASINFPDGGYDYPNRIAAKDSNFIWYQLKDSLSTPDSLRVAIDGKKILENFNEPNLSIRPAGEVIFRFSYFSRTRGETIISMTDHEIIVKEGLRGSIFSETIAKQKLNQLEQFHYQVLKSNFPIHKARLNKKSAPYLDSLIKIYPELLNPGYYEFLDDRFNGSNTGKFEYTSKTIPISKNRFRSLTNQINASGFWKLPYELHSKGECMDANGFILEANTPMKYKIISASVCGRDSSGIFKACQELAKYAGMEQKIELL